MCKQNINNIEKIAKIWQISLNLELENKNRNVRISFKDVGAFCEFLAIDYNDGYMGSGSGSMGLDLVNITTHKAIEVKTCCTIQNGHCYDCGTKFNTLFFDQCPKCGSTNFNNWMNGDSRFGINAVEFMQQYKSNFFDNFTFCHVSNVSYDKKTTFINIKMEWFKVMFNDQSIIDIQLQYFQDQIKFGKGHCNLLPFSFDFYKLNPQKISEVIISFPVNNLEIKPKVSEKKMHRFLRVPLSKIPSEFIQEFKKLKTFSAITNDAEAIDFTINIPYKHKSLGKKRGDTRGKVYKILN